jgi:hypothetical protein
MKVTNILLTKTFDVIVAEKIRAEGLTRTIYMALPFVYIFSIFR